MPVRCTGPSQPLRPPTEASRTSGSAAIARLEGQQSQKKPLSANSQPMKKKERDSGGHVASATATTGAGAHAQTSSSSPGGGGGKNWPEGGRRLDSQVSVGDVYVQCMTV